MRGIREWSIRTRLLVAFLGVLIPYLALVGVGAMGFRALWLGLEAIQREAITELDATSDLQLALARVVMPANDYLITGDPAERERFEQRLGRVTEALRRAKATYFEHPEERRLLEMVKSQVPRIEALSREILATPDPRGDRALAVKMLALDQGSDAAVEALGRVREIGHREIEEQIDRGSRVIRRVVSVALAAVLLSVAGGIGLAFFFSAWLGRPILALAERSRRMAGGDLTQRVEVEPGGELGDLARAFNLMAGRLEHSHAALTRRGEELAALNQVATAVSGSLELGQILDRALDTCLTVLGVEAGEIFLVDEARGEVVLARHRGVAAEVFGEILRFKLGEGVPGRVALSGEPLVTTDLAQDPGFMRKRVVEAGFRSFAAVPLKAKGKVVGTLGLADRRARAFTEEDLGLLTTIGATIGMAVANAGLFEEAEAERARLASVMRSANDAIVLADGEGRILSWNPGAQAIFGYSETEALGQPLTLLMPERYRDAHQHGIERFRSTGVPSIIGKVVELHGVRKDGREFPLELSLATWKLKEDLFFSGIIRDITERRQIDHMKSDFVSFVTHQLRTPLAGIKWLLELAAQEANVPEEAQAYIQDSRASAERLIRLVNDLLDVSRLESGRLTLSPDPTSLYELTLSVVEDLGPLIQDKGHRLLVTGEEKIPPVVVDPQLLRQVILNLASNAIKYTPPGGEIVVRMGREGAEVRWEVRDSGIGIPKGEQRRLFEKFYRAESALTMDTGGTGLGLYLVRLIVERLGGRVRCESEEGKGATFVFTLPWPEGG